jgi:hypothetical protein
MKQMEQEKNLRPHEHEKEYRKTAAEKYLQ